MGRRLVILFLALICLTATSQDVVRRSDATITLEGKRYYMHTVAARQTLYSICKAYRVSEKDVELRNPFIASGLRSGQMLFIPINDQESEPVSNSYRADEKVIRPPVISADPHSIIAPLSDSVATIEPMELGLTANFDLNAPLNVALMLPFGGGNDVTFVDFYRGVIIAIEKLKERGIDVNLTVLSTNSHEGTVSDIIANGALDGANLIIGPVYEKPFAVAAAYAAQRRIPIISPLAQTAAPACPFIIEVAPNDANRWDKVNSIINAYNTNVVVVDYGDYNDSVAMAEMTALAPLYAQRLNYNGKATHISSITSVLSRDKNNVILLPSANENAVEGFLARLSSINSTARYKINVVGTSRWSRFNTLDFELFFKLGVTYPSSYHADRSNSSVSAFYNSYINDFADLPSLFAFRGYDVAGYFISLLASSGQRALFELGEYSTELLQMPYRFEQDGEGGKFRNSAWGLVVYKPDYSITVQ